MLSENYKKYFKMMMDKHGIKSLDQLSAEEKKKFFKAVDKSYKAKNEEVINENPAVIATAARMAIQNQQGKKVSVNTARQSSYSKKDPQAHKKAKSLFQKIKDKFKTKPKKTKSEPKKQSKSSAQKYADLYGGGVKVEFKEGYSMRDVGLSPFFKKLKPIQRQAISIALVMGGNMTGAVKAIEKIKKGLSKDKKVRNALRLANENTAPNHDGKAAPHGSGYKEVDEGTKQYGQKLTDNFFKSVRKFEQEVIVLGKMATKMRGDRTDEKIILKMYKKHMGPFIELIRSWNSTTQKNPHISEGKIQVQGIGMYDDKTLKKKILGMTKDLQKLAKNDEWSKSSENAIKALGRMWGAYQEWARNNESVNEGIFGKFDTGAGFKGNGMTVYDRNQEKSGDFKDIAHIAPNGKITIYDKNVKKEPKLMQSLNKISQEFKKTFKESVNEDVFAIVDKYNDKKQDYDQVYFKDNNLNKVKKHMKKMGSKYGKMNLIRVKTNGKMSLVEGMDKRQAGETLKQLGGNKFIMMTGAKNFAVGPKGMGFKIGRNSKGVNYIRIDLDRGRDLYNMEFIQMRGGNLKIKSKVKGVYNDQLQKIFTKHTGMYTSLGTMGR